MKIEIWTDFNCPFCYIGKKNLDDALKDFKQPIELIFRSFQTFPSCPIGATYSVYEVATSHGMPLAQAQAKSRYLEDLASSVGLTFDMDSVTMTNTIDAHRLVKYAEQFKLSEKLTNRLFSAVYSEGKHIGEHIQLAELANEVGLDKTLVLNMLATNAFKDDVQKDISLAPQYRVQGVPHFVLDNQYIINGAKPKTVFLDALNGIVALTNKVDHSCDEIGCNIR